ncbi:hypothetical protein FA04_14605 [Ensifer adhaerens]|uniref:Transposase n=1 Tax=Ensifer adhaerens TaxID=106592 RepID=A0ABY8HDZ1_ENSAD|nr:hypothetical protein [Ensifer adhaerens]ANK73742.1 hypothetical protein FA04_14605 [Ensifer adhaerens]KDP70296.1 hypothetical protein FA04_29105 [Ensifer adhaerens]WFP89827.1 hypothetical protein P4B07_14835 [Ensifer adhaerens]
MSYTIIRDYAEERREFENRINAVLRHCRIGKVKNKPRKSMSEFLKKANMRPTGWHPLTGARSATPFF